MTENLLNYCLIFHVRRCNECDLVEIVKKFCFDKMMKERNPLIHDICFVHFLISIKGYIDIFIFIL